MKRTLLSILVIGILLLSACGTPSAPPPTPSPTEQPAPTPTFEPIVITGSSDKVSPPFTVTTEEWIIEWWYVPSPAEVVIFGFYVFPRGETLEDVASVLFPRGTSGSTYVYAGAGDYYIDVTAAMVESWEIVISPP